MVKKYRMLIGGSWVESEDWFEVKSPFSFENLGFVPIASEQHVGDAVNNASESFLSFSEMPAYERSRILEETSKLIGKNRLEITEIIVRESGKAWKYASLEVERAIQTFKFASEEAKRIHGETIPMDTSYGNENRIAFYMRFPLGVVGAITPFNFPLNLVVHKIAPAIASGNSIVLKPSSYTCLLYTSDAADE